MAGGLFKGQATRGAAVAKKRRPPRTDAGSGVRTPLPTDVLADATRRVRVMALIYAATFFALGPIAALASAAGRLAFFSTPLKWGPSVISIGVALLVAAASLSRRLPSKTVLAMGLAFEVVGSYGIAAARYLDPQPQPAAAPTVSWVAIWILLFATLVPCPPRRAALTALLSATAVPIVLAIGLARQDTAAPVLDVALRAFAPYLLVVVLVYIAARVVYRLGTEITHARELGSYRLVQPIGQGGMGEVWRAEHHLLARPAAIKLIRPPAHGDGTDFAELRERFEREAHATASLRSPHTIQLYDFGVADDGTFYYVMELLDGFDLHTLVERFGPVPVERAIFLLEQVCHSLGEAHAGGLIHRDIKPANVYVCRYGREVDFVKVLDFGLVKPATDTQRTTRIDLTAAHVAHGTPAFMAPEQAIGDKPVDARADLYALGCLAYWLVTGRHVFSGHNALDTIVKHVQAAPDPPSRHAPGIPPDFDDLILACLAKDPAARPASADGVAVRLRAMARAQPWSEAQAHAWWLAEAPRAGAIEPVHLPSK
jgi:eukaryotic-like serine/threonine-protein kinase